MPTLTTLTSALRTEDLHLTPQRTAICDLLATSNKNPTAATIYNVPKPHLLSLSLATCFATLQVPVDLGQVNMLWNTGDDNFY